MNNRFLFLVMLLFLVAVSVFAQDVEDFETGDFSSFEWQLSGDADWFITNSAPHGGTYCAQGGDIDDSQTTSISITREVSQESNISFYWKVSSEQNWDYLRFYVDDEEVANITGVQDWTLFEYTVSLGTHTFKWSYTKDGSVSSNDDTGWIDDITFPMSITYDNDLAITAFSAQNYVNQGEQIIADCTVRNVGNNPQSEFSLALLDNVGNVLYNIDITEDLQPDQSQTYQLTYNVPVSQQPGSFVIHAELTMQNDENLNNNISSDFVVHILPQGLMLFDIGDGNEQSNWTPIDFFYKSSISEVIYYQDELPPAGSLISIKYYYNFTEGLSDQPINIWVGETDLDGLDEGWISAPELQQVFSGNLDFPQDQNSIDILLDTPYVYTGERNLIILVERPLDSQYYSSSDKFICTNVGEHANRSRSYYSDSSPMDPQNLDNGMGSIRNIFPNTSLGFIVGGLGDIQGFVYNEQDQPMENVLVEILGTDRSAYTNADGSFAFTNINPGIYSMQASYSGYNPQVLENIEVVEDDTTLVEFNLVPLSSASISGHVVGSDAPETPLVDAQVTLTGFADYNTTTDDNGDFVFPDVYCGHTYHITITYAGYSDYSADIEFGDTDLDLGTITLNEIAYPPANVMAEQNDEQTIATVYWSNSGSFSGEFRYDDGEMVGQIGSASTPPNAAFGSKFIGNALLNEIKWYLTSEYTSHPTVKILIFSLDAQYNPTSNVVFDSGLISNIDDEWNSYVFDSPLEVDFGFMIAVSTPNTYTGLGYDDGVGAPWEFVQNTQYLTDDYTTGNWTPIETYGFYNNLMIRAYGSEIGKKASKDRSLEGYKIYRFNVENQDDHDLWDVIAENVSVTDTMYVDSTYAQLPIGSYRYAVSSIYTNNVESQATLSNVLIKTSVQNEPNEIVGLTTNISQNYPNPFIPSVAKSAKTYFNISVKENEIADLSIYNLKGQVVKIYKNIKSGKHTIAWNGKDKNGKEVASGVYLYRLKSKSVNKVKKMVIIKR